MKVAQPPLASIPDRKPDAGSAPAAEGSGPSFQDLLSQSRPVPHGRLANGQKAPPTPVEKPEPPIVLDDGSFVPIPARKPGAAAAGTTGERVALASQQVAGLSGHSFTAILAQATQESGLDSTARNKSSSAAGPFQFLERTWLDLFRRHGSAYGQGQLASAIQSHDGVPSVKDAATRRKILDLRQDVDLSAGMAARYLAEGRERLEKRLKRPVTESESRIAYVMGAGGAAKLIRAAESNPKAMAADLLPSAAKSNRNLFYDRSSGRALTAAESITRLTRRMETEQKDMFAAIAQASGSRQRLDGAPSPLSAFQSASASGADADSGAQPGADSGSNPSAEGGAGAGDGTPGGGRIG